MEVTQLNRWLEDKTALYASADDILREWKLLGVVKVEVSPSTLSDYGRRPSGRMLNLIIGHRVSLLNIFGKNVVDGGKLYIVVKKVRCRSTKRSRGGKPPDNSLKWRLLPYANKNNQKPSLRMLSYNEPLDPTNPSSPVVTRYGSCYYVGKAGESFGGGDGRSMYGQSFDQCSEYNMSLVQNNMSDGTMDVYLGI